MVYLVSVTFSPSLTLFHLNPSSILQSTVYPVTGVPPSDRGGVHDNTHDRFLMSDTVGLPGGPGGSEKDKRHRFIDRLFGNRFTNTSVQRNCLVHEIIE